MTRDLSYDFGISVTTPRYALVAADGTVGAQVNPLTAGFLINSDIGSYFVPQVNVGASRGVLWTCATDVHLSEFQAFYENGAIDPGTGAYVVTVTVTDGTNPLQGAVVQIRNGVTTGTGVTDASGHADLIGNALTYTVSVFKDGYTFTATTRTITGNQAGTLVNNLVMTAAVIPSPPADPTMGTLYGYFLPTDGSARSGYSLIANLVGDDDSTGPFLLGASSVAVPLAKSDVSDSDGLASIDLIANANITPAGSRWRITAPGTQFLKEIRVVAGTSVNIGTFIA